MNVKRKEKKDHQLNTTFLLLLQQGISKECSDFIAFCHHQKPSTRNWLLEQAWNQMFQANHKTIKFLHNLQKQFQKPPFRLTSQHDDVSHTCCVHNKRKESLSHETRSLIRHMKNDLLSLDTFYEELTNTCLLYTSPSPRDGATSRMPSSA